MSSNVYAENNIPVVAEAGGYLTKKNIKVVGGAGVVDFTGALSVALGNVTQGSQVTTSTSANALTVGANGTTNPQFNVDDSTTSVATGLNVKGAAAGSGLAVSTLSSGTNENLTIDAKGSGTVTINGTATGIVVLPAGTTIGGSVPLTSTITSSSANALTVGPNGATNPTFNVDASTASAATGLNIKSAAATGGLALSVLSSGANENLTLNAKGTGSITIGNVSTGNIVLSALVTTSNASLRMQSGSANALSVGASGGTTNPALNVDASTGSSATGLNIKSAASGGGLALTTISSGTNENLTLAAKGTGTFTVNPASTLTSGGLASSSVLIGASSIGVYVGTGAPTISAAQGSLYLNNAGNSTSTRLYVNSNGSTTWVAVTTAS